MPALGVCSRCGERLTTSTAVEVRREYRALRDLSRVRTWRERLVCRGCALDEAEHHDHPNGRQGEQRAIAFGDAAGLDEDDATALVLATFPGAEPIDPGEEGRIL